MITPLDAINSLIEYQKFLGKSFFHGRVQANSVRIHYSPHCTRALSWPFCRNAQDELFQVSFTPSLGTRLSGIYTC